MINLEKECRNCMWFSYTYWGKWCDWYHHPTNFSDGHDCKMFECGIPKKVIVNCKTGEINFEYS